MALITMETLSSGVPPTLLNFGFPVLGSRFLLSLVFGVESIIAIIMHYAMAP